MYSKWLQNTKYKTWTFHVWGNCKIFLTRMRQDLQIVHWWGGPLFHSTRTERKWCQIENNFVAFRENYVMVDLMEHSIFVKIIPLFVDFRCKMHKQTASHCQYNNAQSLSMNMTWFPVNIEHGVHIGWIYLQKISVAFRRGHLVSCR